MASLLPVASAVFAQEPLPIADRPLVVGCTLLDGSYPVDDCLISGRPTILQPMRSTFDLVLASYDPFVSR